MKIPTGYETINPHQSGMAAGYHLGDPHPSAKPAPSRETCASAPPLHQAGGDLPRRSGPPWSMGTPRASLGGLASAMLGEGGGGGGGAAVFAFPSGGAIVDGISARSGLPAAGLAIAAGATATEARQPESAFALFAASYALPTWRDDQIARAAWNAALAAFASRAESGRTAEGILDDLVVDPIHPSDVDARHREEKDARRAAGYPGAHLMTDEDLEAAARDYARSPDERVRAWGKQCADELAERRKSTPQPSEE